MRRKLDITLAMLVGAALALGFVATLANALPTHPRSIPGHLKPVVRLAAL